MRHQVVVPELGVGERAIVVSLWLVERGAEVAAGDPVVELLAGAAVVDVSAPADGVLVRRLAAEGDTVRVGQRLGLIVANPR